MPFFAHLFLRIRKTFEEKGKRLVGDRPDLFGAGFVDTHYYGCNRNQRQILGILIQILVKKRRICSVA